MSWVQSLIRRLKKFRNTRLYPRFPAGDVDIQIMPREGGPSVRTKIADWSPGGLFVLTKERLPLETKVDMELRVRSPSGPQTIQLEGQVVRHHLDETTGEYEGMGIMFTNFTQQGLKTLQDFLTGG
jgi:c-di-GMP-binding flagellar brake protein YcgR